VTDHFDIYTWGLLEASVCTDLSDEKATQRLNLELPTGISSQWRISPEDFLDGTPNGSPCNQQWEGRRHVLFHC
jgi:hypothetical protein